MVEASVSSFGRKTALEFFGAETSYRDLGREISRASEGLRRLGLRTGDRVAIVLPNCPQHIVTFYAVLRSIPSSRSTSPAPCRSAHG